MCRFLCIGTASLLYSVCKKRKSGSRKPLQEKKLLIYYI